MNNVLGTPNLYDLSDLFMSYNKKITEKLLCKDAT